MLSEAMIAARIAMMKDALTEYLTRYPKLGRKHLDTEIATIIEELLPEDTSQQLQWLAYLLRNHHVGYEPSPEVSHASGFWDMVTEMITQYLHSTLNEQHRNLTKGKGLSS